MRLPMRKEILAAINGPAARAYNETVTPGAEKAQEALMQLAGKIPLGKGNQSKVVGMVDRMAASPEVLTALKATPALASIYGTTVGADMINQIFSPEQESFANTGMDLLGMGATTGAAAYGLNRGTNRLGGTTRAGSALALAAAAGLGKLGSDTVQGIF